MRRQRQRGGLARTATRAFVWVVLAIFVFTSVGVALVVLK
jgi:hypothetical protein